MSRTFNLAAVALCFVAFTANGQTLRSNPAALSRVQGGNESDVEYASRLLGASVSSVQGKGHFCSSTGDQLAPQQAGVKLRKQRDKQVCALLEPLTSSTVLNFDGSDSGNLCSPYWKDGIPPWKDPMLMELAKVSKTYATKNYVPPSRSEMLKRGFTLMSRDQATAYIKKVEALREEAASFCCDAKSSEGQECARAMREVKIEVCQNDSSETDPSRPDSCATANGAYNRTRSEGIQILAQTLRDGAATKGIPKSKLDEAIQKFGPSLESNEVKALNIVPGDKVVSGRIILSPYLKEGLPNGNNVTIVHELMHGCSAIRKQLDVKHDTPSASSSMQSTLVGFTNSCELPASTVESFVGFFSAVQVNRNGLSSCLAKIAEKSTDPESDVFTESACPKAKMEEAFADAMSFLLTESIVPDAYPNKVCRAVPSVTHAHASEVMKCLVINAPHFKKFLVGAFECPTASAQ